MDTGSTTSVINASGLYRLGLTPERLARDRIVPLTSIDGRLPAHLHRFANLRKGPLTISCPELLTAEIPEAGFDLILGMDVLGRQNLRLSYTEMKLAFAGV